MQCAPGKVFAVCKQLGIGGAMQLDDEDFIERMQHRVQLVELIHRFTPLACAPASQGLMIVPCPARNKGECIVDVSNNTWSCIAQCEDPTCPKGGGPVEFMQQLQHLGSKTSAAQLLDAMFPEDTTCNGCV